MAYPIILDITGRKAAVIGGGKVARRKVIGLLAQGAVVAVTSPKLEKGLAGLVREQGLIWRERGFEAADLDGCILAFAATDDPEVNKAVVEAARKRGVLVNVAETPENGDFSLPANLRRGGLLISVSTGGASPLLAADIRDGLAGQFGDVWAEYIDLMAALRAAVLARGGPASENRELFRALLGADLPIPLAEGDNAELENRIQAACGLSLSDLKGS